MKKYIQIYLTFAGFLCLLLPAYAMTKQEFNANCKSNLELSKCKAYLKYNREKYNATNSSSPIPIKVIPFKK